MSDNFLREWLSRPPESQPVERLWRPVAIGPAGWQIQTSLTTEETTALQSLSGPSDVLPIGKRVLEVGAAYGYSAIAMALGGAWHVLSVDPHNGEVLDSLRLMQWNIKECGVGSRVTAAVGYSQDVLPKLIAAGAKFDLVFVDGDHSTAAVEADLRLATMLTSEAIAFHDYGEVTCPGVKQALDASLYKPTAIIGTLWIWSVTGEL